MSSDIQDQERSFRKEEKRRLRKEEKRERKERKKERKTERSSKDGEVEDSDRQIQKGHKKRKRHTESEADETVRSTKKSRHEDGLELRRSEAASFQSSDHSPFYNQTSSFYLPISPISLAKPLEGLCAEHLSPLILTYHPLFRAIVLSYSNVHLGEEPTTSPNIEPVLAKSIDEYAVSFVWVTADFLLFSPQKGDQIEGQINLQDKSHVGLVCWNLFNASIERIRLPKSWKWHTITSRNDGEVTSNHTESIESQPRASKNGYYKDEHGLALAGKITFRVKDTETSSGKDKGFLSIEGTCLKSEEEVALLEEEKDSIQRRSSAVPDRRNQSIGLVARRLGTLEALVDANPGFSNESHGATY